VEEVFEQLKCSRQGLTSEEGQKRLQIFGPNKLEEKKARYQSLFLFELISIPNTSTTLSTKMLMFLL